MNKFMNSINNMRGLLFLILAGFLILTSIVFTVVLVKKGDEPIMPTTLPVTIDEPSYPEPATELVTSMPTLPQVVSTSEGETTTAQAATTAPATAATTASPATQAVTAQSDYAYAYAGLNPALATIDEAKWNLLLVNRDYILPEDHEVRLANVGDNSQQLDYRVAPQYTKMVEAAKADGISLISISGYRSYTRQKNNFENKINYYVGLGYSKAEATHLAAEIILPPGTSEHNAGLAMDIGTNGDYSLEESFALTDAFKWLTENAEDYGFILRYDKNTKDITKITYEPWHWRYVGVEAAKAINASGLTLEEFITQMQ